jgi:hypothetical protein
MRGLRLIKVDFDGMENRLPEAVCKEELATFVDDGRDSAYRKAEGYLSVLAPVKVYLGWDQQVYPQFRLEPVEVK